MTLPARSNVLGALAWPLTGLETPVPAPFVATRSISTKAPLAYRP